MIQAQSQPVAVLIQNRLSQAAPKTRATNRPGDSPGRKIDCARRFSARWPPFRIASGATEDAAKGRTLGRLDFRFSICSSCPSRRD